MNRRDFLRWLGIGTTSTFVFGSGVWKPSNAFELIPNPIGMMDVGMSSRDLLTIIKHSYPMDMLYISTFQHVKDRNSIHRRLVFDDLR